MTSEKQLYLCVLLYEDVEESGRLMFPHAVVAASEAEAIAEAQGAATEARKGGQLTKLRSAHAFVIPKGTLEQAAVDVLGWMPPPYKV